MVEAVVDPIRIPTLNLSEQELDEIAVLIEQGKLPKDFLEKHFDAVDANVFGIDAPKDGEGNRMEQGLGSARNQTANSIAAYKKYCNPDNPKAADPDPDFKENLKRMLAELAACDKERKAKAATQRKNYGRGRR